MSVDPSATNEGPGWPVALALVIFGLLFVTRALPVLLFNEPVSAKDIFQLAFTAALFVVPVLFVLPRPRRLLLRHRWPVLAAQGLVTWIPFAFFGSSWQVGAGGLLAGLLPLCFSGWGPWVAAVGLLIADVVLRAAVTGLPWEPAWSGALWASIAFVDTAIVTFGIIRLTQVLEDLRRAHAAAAESAVAGERLRATHALESVIVAGVEQIARSVATAERLCTTRSAEAASLINKVGESARRLGAQARRLLSNPGAQPSEQDRRTTPTRTAVGARLTWIILLIVLCGFAAAGINDAYDDHVGGRLLVVLAVGTAVFVALQIYHAWLGRREVRGSLWVLTLGAQICIVYAFFLPAISVYFTIAGFMAGSILVLAPRGVRVIAFATVVGSWSALHSLVAVHGQPPSDRGAIVDVYSTSFVIFTGLLTFGLVRLAKAARELDAVRVELARTAGVFERIRIARDVHDLLGLGLAALALKADLVSQLIVRGDPRGSAEIRSLGRICAATRADVRNLDGQSRPTSTDEELAAAAEILESAGIQLQVCLDDDPLRPEIDHVLVPVLREAVTNVLRHATATWCSIELVRTGDFFHLVVANDGVRGGEAPPEVMGPEESESPAHRHGLTNLRSRIEMAGGTMRTQWPGRRFLLIADIPLPSETVSRDR